MVLARSLLPHPNAAAGKVQHPGHRDDFRPSGPRTLERNRGFGGDHVVALEHFEVVVLHRLPPFDGRPPCASPLSPGDCALDESLHPIFLRPASDKSERATSISPHFALDPIAVSIDASRRPTSHERHLPNANRRDARRCRPFTRHCNRRAPSSLRPDPPFSGAILCDFSACPGRASRSAAGPISRIAAKRFDLAQNAASTSARGRDEFGYVH